MRFPNAAKGIGKIYLGEILELIGVVLLGIGAAAALVGMRSEGAVTEDVSVGIAMGTLITAIPGLILPLIAEVLILLGLMDASKDEPTNLRTAFLCALGTIVVSLVGSILHSITGNGLLSSFTTLITNLLDIFATIFTIAGISNLMQRMRRPDIASKGNRLLWLLVAAQVVTTLSHILPQGTFQTVLDALACIFSVVAYVLYLGYLRQSRNVLQA